MPTVAILLEPKKLSLADAAVLTLRIEAMQPAKVVVPDDWLSEEAAGFWTIEPTERPRIESADGRWTWQRSYRLSPYQLGDSVPLKLRDVIVDGERMSLPDEFLSVTSQFSEVDIRSIRPLTGIEPSEVPIPGFPLASIILIAVAAAGIMFAAVASWILFLRRRHTTPTRTPLDQLVNDFALDDRPEAIATAWKTYLTIRFGLDAVAATTAEWRAKLAAAAIAKADELVELDTLFAELDQQRYGTVEKKSTDGTAAALLAMARRWESHSANGAE